MLKILYVCIHNSSRSQIAEEYTRLLGTDDLFVESAGLEAGSLNPFVVQVLLEDGIDISQKKTQCVIDLFNNNKTYDYVITVCSREAEENCPIFPGVLKRINWPFEDPTKYSGTDKEIRDKTRALRDQIKERVGTFLLEIQAHR